MAADLGSQTNEAAFPVWQDPRVNTPSELGAESPKLSRSLLVFYGLPMAAFLAVSMPISIWLMKFATDELLVPPAAMGTIFLVARIWDAISDPLAGYLSDRTRSRLGRRRSWLIACVVPFALTLVMLWAPPAVLDGTMLILWIGAALILWETAATAFWIPYNALGLELTSDHHERTRLFAWRQILSTVGFAASLSLVYLIRTAAEPRETAFATSVGLGLVFGILVVLCTLRISESQQSQGRGGTGLVASFRDVAANPHALILFFLLGIEAFGMGIVATLAAYIMDDLVRRPDLLEMLLAAWMIPQFLLVPFWIQLSARFGKKALWMFGLGCMVVGFAGQFFLAENAWPLVFGCVLLLGTGGSIANVVGPSIQADVVDYDEMMTGQRKEGAYTAVWNFIRKAGSALAAGVGGIVLSATGYDPAAEMQSEAVQDGIRYTVGIAPACIYLVALIVMKRFSLDEAEHAKVIARIRERSKN